MALTLQSALVAACFALAAGSCLAGGNHEHSHKPQHGGVAVETKELDYELVAKPQAISLYLRDHGKPVSSKGIEVLLVMRSGGEPSELALKPAGENKLEATGSFKVGPGTQVVATVARPGKVPINVRFVLK